MKKLFFTLSILYLLVFQANSQNVFDQDHSKQFAGFLYNTNQYAYAAEEYERLVHFCPQDTTFKISLIRSYRKSENFSQANLRLQSFYNIYSDSFPANFATEFCKIQFASQQYSLAYQFLNQNKTLNYDSKTEIQMASLLLDKKWNDAYGFGVAHKPAATLKYAQMLIFTKDLESLSYKSPAFAACLSTVIPGSGKMYSKQSKDGIFSLLLIAASGWQAYRGFKKYGDNSTYGWIFASLTTSFYLGNIYGSFHAARKYNEKLDNTLVDKVKGIVFTDF